MPAKPSQRSKAAKRQGGGRTEQAMASSKHDHQSRTPPERLRTSDRLATDQHDANASTLWSRLRVQIDDLFYLWGAIVEGLPFVLLYVRSVIVSYRGMHLLAHLESIWLQGVCAFEPQSEANGGQVRVAVPVRTQYCVLHLLQASNTW